MEILGDLLEAVLDVAECAHDIEREQRIKELESQLGHNHYVGVDPDAASTNWICPKCGRNVKFVRHCLCGYDFNPATDRMVKPAPEKPVFPDGSPQAVVSVERRECPHCGAILKVTDKTCFNCNAAVDFTPVKADGRKRNVRRKHCPSCNTEAGEGDLFCSNCGFRL